MTMTKDAIQYLQESGIKPEDRLVNFDNDERWLAFDNSGQAKISIHAPYKGCNSNRTLAKRIDSNLARSRCILYRVHGLKYNPS